MEPRVTTTVVGLLTLIGGVLALVFPEFVMAYALGFAVHPSFSATFAHGEVRAAYGGIFTVMGFATVLAAMDPPAHRSRILFVGLLLLGACGGRVFGALAEGSPGIWGWLIAVAELLMGGALVVVAQGAGTADRRGTPEYRPPRSYEPAAPPPPAPPPPTDPAP